MIRDVFELTICPASRYSMCSMLTCPASLYFFQQESVASGDGSAWRGSVLIEKSGYIKVTVFTLEV